MYIYVNMDMLNSGNSTICLTICLLRPPHFQNCMKELFFWWVGCAFVKRHGLDPRDVYPPLSSFILALLGVDDELWILERLDPPLFKRKGHPGPGLRTVRKACS